MHIISINYSSCKTCAILGGTRAVTFAVCLATVLFALPGSGASLKKGPYLIYPGDPSQMTVLWQADGPPASSTIEWGLSPDCGSVPVAVPGYGSDYQYSYTIQGLVPGATYYYCITVDGAPSLGTFHAAPLPSAGALSFYVYGDSRTYPSIQNTVLGRLMADMEADPQSRQGLVLHTGDLVGSGLLESYWTLEDFPRDQPDMLRFQANMVKMPVRGNHEVDGVLFRKYYPAAYQNAPLCYYSFDWGPCHFTMVDDQADRSYGSAQYAWLSADVSGTPSPWKFVLWHMPAYGGGGHPNDTTNQGLTTDVLAPSGVGMIFAGHNHQYARAEVTDAGLLVRHITSGGGGAPLYACETMPGLVSCSKSYGFVRVDITGCQIAMTSYNELGAIIDSTSYQRTGCACPMSVVISPKAGSLVCPGTTAILTASPVGGSGPFGFQWTEDGVDIPGATSSILSVSKPSPQIHAYNCKVTDASGSCNGVADSNSPTVEWSFPPPAPSAPSFSQVACETMTVSWPQVHGATSYDLYRKTGECGAGSQVASGLAGSSYHDSSLAQGTQYSYYAFAKNGCGASSEGDCSSQVTLTTCIPPPEAAPGNLPSTAQAWSDRATQSWPTVDGASGYRFYRGMRGDLPQLLVAAEDSCLRYDGPATTATGLTEDPALAAGGFYWYVVTAYNAFGEESAGNATAGPRSVNSSGACDGLRR